MGKKTKKITKQSKRRLVILGPVSIIAVLVIFYTAISSTYKQLTLKEYENDLKLELESLEDKEVELRNEVSKLQEPEYLARYARETYLYTKDGEYVIKIDPKKKVLKKSESFFEKYMYYIIASIILVFILVIMIIRSIFKSKKIEG